MSDWPCFVAVQVVDREGLAGQRVRDRERRVVTRRHQNVVGALELARFAPDPRGAQRHARHQLAIDADHVLQVRGPLDVLVRTTRRRDAEAVVVARPDFVVLGDVVAVQVRPVARVGLDRQRVVPVVLVRHRLVVLADAALERRPAVAEQVVRHTQPRTDVPPVHDIGDAGEAAAPARTGPPARPRPRSSRSCDTSERRG